MSEPIITEHWAKPGPERQWDWSAHRKSYEPGWPIGYGRTEQYAIDELLEQEKSLQSTRLDSQTAKQEER